MNFPDNTPTSIAMYLAFTYLLPWGVRPELDEFCSKLLYLHPPRPAVSFLIKGFVYIFLEVFFFFCERFLPSYSNQKISVKEHMSLILPASTNEIMRYSYSGVLNTLLALSGVAFCKTLLPVPCENCFIFFWIFLDAIFGH